jgi:hypothetical protein
MCLYSINSSKEESVSKLKTIYHSTEEILKEYETVLKKEVWLCIRKIF